MWLRLVPPLPCHLRHIHRSNQEILNPVSLPVGLAGAAARKRLPAGAGGSCEHVGPLSSTSVGRRGAQCFPLCHPQCCSRPPESQGLVTDATLLYDLSYYPNGPYFWCLNTCVYHKVFIETVKNSSWWKICDTLCDTRKRNPYSSRSRSVKTVFSPNYFFFEILFLKEKFKAQTKQNWRNH